MMPMTGWVELASSLLRPSLLISPVPSSRLSARGSNRTMVTENTQRKLLARWEGKRIQNHVHQSQFSEALTEIYIRSQSQVVDPPYDPDKQYYD